MKTAKAPKPQNEWKSHLSSYRYKKALQFPDRQERDRLLAALWNDDDLYGVPRDYAGALLLIVPEPAVEVLRKKGFKFIVRDVIGP